MRYAIFSDVHANKTAFEAMLLDAQRCKADVLISLGDVVGYGPDAAECVNIARNSTAVNLMGNHDAAVAGLLDTEEFNEYAAEVAQYHRRMLNQEQVQWLAALPYVYVGATFACAHANLAEPETFAYLETPADAEDSLAVRPEKILFVGHTHERAIFVADGEAPPRKLPMQDFVLEDGLRYVVNVGTCGYPRGQTRLSYVIYDEGETRAAVYLREIPFELGEYTARIRKSGMRMHEERERRLRKVYSAAAVIATLTVLVGGLAYHAVHKTPPPVATKEAKSAPDQETTAERPAFREVYNVPENAYCVDFKIAIKRNAEPAHVAFSFLDGGGALLHSTKSMERWVKESWTQTRRTSSGFKIPPGARTMILEIAPRQSGMDGITISPPKFPER
ncbi:MAG: metallophosphatase family protein [Kiritimatiellae bacterium]|nr:metallophosphatase family protein [Kiritimatiellia bacterium]